MKWKKALATLDEADIWTRPNAASNSIGNLVLHLCGNITQYILSALGGDADDRQRDAEFAAQQGATKAILFQNLATTIAVAKTVIAAMDDDELAAVKMIQGKPFSGIANILHVVEHFSYHTGQVIFWTKSLKNQDMEFYANWAVNAKNA